MGQCATSHKQSKYSVGSDATNEVNSNNQTNSSLKNEGDFQPSAESLSSTLKARMLSSLPMMDVISTPSQSRGILRSSNSFRGNMVQNFYAVEIEQKYEISKKVLGSGASSEVVLVSHKQSKKQYAMKSFSIEKKGMKQREFFSNEISILKELDHPNVVRLFQGYENVDHLHMVLELCSGGHLLRVLNNQPRRRVCETQAALFASQILRAINHCHGKGICHRDLKLENVMLERASSDAQVKIIDFGYATTFTPENPRMKAFVGTAYSTSPEVFRRDYSEKCDMWSIGVITYTMICGCRPFTGVAAAGDERGKYNSMVSKILASDYSWPARSNPSEIASDFVDRLLNPDENRRMSAREALDHPYIQKVVEKSGGSARLVPLLQPLEQMSSFGALKKQSMMAIAFTMNQAQIDMLRECFCEMDKDHSGTLDLTEFSQALNKVMPLAGGEECKKLFASIDQDQNGEISYLEFLAAAMDKNHLSMKELENAFKLMDVDGNGYLEQEDFEQILGDTSINNKEGIKDMLARADVDGDGKVSYAEFIIAMSASEDVLPEEGVKPVNLFFREKQGRKEGKRQQKPKKVFKRCHSDSTLDTADPNKKNRMHLSLIEDSMEKAVENKYVQEMPVDPEKLRLEEILNEKENIRKATASLSPMSSVPTNQAQNEFRDAHSTPPTIFESPLIFINKSSSPVVNFGAKVKMSNLLSNNSSLDRMAASKSIDSVSTDNILCS